MVLTSRNSHEELLAAGYVICPESRYVDEAHGIDWAIILWQCGACSSERTAPGPGEPPHCDNGHGPMVEVVIEPAP